MDTTTAAPVLTDPFARLLEQEKAARTPLVTPVLPAPPTGGDNPFLAIPNAVQAPAPDLADATVVDEPVVTETVEDVAEPPKRKRGRPRKNPLPEEVSPEPEAISADVSPRDLIISHPLDRAWVALGDRITASEAQVAGLRQRAEEVSRQGQEIESLREEITTLQAKVDQLTEAGKSLGAADELLRQADMAAEQVAQVVTLRQQVADFLVALNGGNSGTVGAVRITVIDGKAHLDRSG